ncbi:MAG: hypothetical protein P8M72_12105 [Gammaproteobacteria bacterium]|nr:hypothetical protein [Gammaproteobacteria bacterium]
MLNIKIPITLKVLHFSKALVLFAGISTISLAVVGQVDIVTCADIQDSAARLACYDEATTQNQNLPVIRLPRGSASSSSEVSETASESTSRVDQFGLDLSRGGARTTRTLRVVAATRNDFTGWTIEFEGAGKWRQVGTDKYDIDVGQLYTVRRGTLNSFMLSNSSNNRKLRIKRVE